MAFGDQVFEPELFATAPNAGGSIDAHPLFAFLAFSAFFRLATGDDHPLLVFLKKINLLQLPHFALAETETGLVLEQEGMILGRIRNFPTRDHRHRRKIWVGRQIEAAVQHRAQWDIPEIRWRTVIACHAIGEHGKRVRGR